MAALDIQIGPAAGVGDRDVEAGADGSEQRLQVDLLNQTLDVDRLVLPEADRGPIGCSAATLLTINSALSSTDDSVDLLQILGEPLAVLDADVERQQAGLPAIVDQRLGGIEVALSQPMLLEQVGPAAATRPRCALTLDVEDQVAEGLQIRLVSGLRFRRLPSWRPPWQDRRRLLGVPLAPLLIGDAPLGAIQLAEVGRGLAVAPVDVALGDLVDRFPEGRLLVAVNDDMDLP